VITPFRIMSSAVTVDRQLDILSHCIHCGLCLPQCPTYSLTGREISSPRGRIQLMKAVSEGKMTLSETFAREMDFCLDCQACESACPAGVQYGQLVEHARAVLFESHHLSPIRRWIQTIIFRRVLPSRTVLRWLGTLVYLYEKSGLRWLGEQLLEVISPSLASRAKLLPSVLTRPSTANFRRASHVYVKQGFRVGFLTGCLMDLFYHKENNDTVELLTSLRFDVVVLEGQSCCGSLPGHYGDIQAARRIAREAMKKFNSANVDVIVMNSAGCGAFMKGYGELFAGTEEEATAREFAMRVQDISEFLMRNVATWPEQTSKLRGKRVTFHDPCHLVHSQRIYDQPRQLIKSISGVTFVELAESTWCCGSAGLYNVIRHEESRKLLQRKLQNIMEAKVDILVTSNHGCMAQLMYGLRSVGSDVRLVHLVTFLREAYGI
jgi:glycolate oxidase iron-sulfur subunit